MKQAEVLKKIKDGLEEYLHQKILAYQENAWRYDNEPELVVRHSARVHEAERGVLVDLRNEIEKGLLSKFVLKT